MGEQWRDLAGHQELMTSRTHSVEVACCVPPSNSSAVKMAGSGEMSKILMKKPLNDERESRSKCEAPQKKIINKLIRRLGSNI